MSKSESFKENEKEASALPFAKNKAFLTSSFAIFCLWLVFSWQGLQTVVEIWYGNEIFNHGFFIVPGAFYLIYLKRKELLDRPFQTSLLAFIVVIPALLLYIIGIAGDIQLFLHTATFTLLPALIWLLIGTKAAKTILFPLVFMLFSIPVGEQLIPYLQEIAADGSVMLLQLTGVPLFRSGLYIEIPQGRFLVAEACSGVSFFIASFVIGSLYSYLNLVSTKRRIAFVAISLIFPVLANIVRVYGIILIAYWTDMEHAAGADHIIYGWFFFAFVIVCLLGIGEFLREKQAGSSNHSVTDVTVRFKKHEFATILIAATCLVLFSFWGGMIEDRKYSVRLLGSEYENEFEVDEKCFEELNWRPLLNKPDITKTQTLNGITPCESLLVRAMFSGVENELVSDLNRLYDPEMWARESGFSIITKNDDPSSLSGLRLTSPSGESLYVTHWYLINGKVFTSDVEAKLYQTFILLKGLPNNGEFLVIAAKSRDVLEMNASKVLSTQY